MVDDRLAEGLALLGVRHGGVESALRQTGRHGGDAEPSGVEAGQRDREPLALVAETALDRDAYVVEQHRGRRRAHQAHLLLGGVCRQPLGVCGYEEARDAAAAVIRGASHDLVEVGVPAMRRPGLRAVDDVGVAVAYGLGTHRRRIGAGVRLRQAVGAELIARQHPGQPFLLLLVVAGGEQAEARQRVHRRADTYRRPRRADLLQHLQVDLVRLPAPAELLGIGQRQQPGATQRTEHVARERRRRLSLGRLGSELLGDDLAGQGDEVL